MTDKLNQEDVSILRKAADLIENHGHCKGDYKRSHGHSGYCALGAMNRVTTGDVTSTHKNLRACRALVRYLDIDGSHLCYGPRTSIVDWNDEPWRTADEVVNALRVTAALHDKSPAPELQEIVTR